MKSIFIAALLLLPSLVLADSFTLSPDVPLCSDITLSSGSVLRDFDLIESEDENFYFHPTTMTCLEIDSRPYRVKQIWTEEPKEEEVAWRELMPSGLIVLIGQKDGSISWADAPAIVVDTEPIVVIDTSPAIIVDTTPVVIVDSAPAIVVDTAPIIVIDTTPVIVVDTAPVNLLDGPQFVRAVLDGAGPFVSQRVHLSSGIPYIFSAWVTIIDSGTSSWGTVNLTLSKYQDVGSADYGFVAIPRGIVGDQRLILRYVPDMDRDIYAGIRNFGFNGTSQVNEVTGFAQQ